MGGKLTNRRQPRRRPKTGEAKSYPENPGHTALENTDPMKAGEALEAHLRDPTARVYDLAKDMGLPEGVVQGLIRRWKSRYLGLKVELQSHTQDEFRELIEDRLFRVLTNMDDSMIAGASFRDLTHAMDKLMNARQLIRGEPTAIITVDDRTQMKRVLPLLAQEMQRRGLTIEGESKVVEQD